MNAAGFGVLPILQSVHATGRLVGLLLELTVRHTYRNASNEALEVSYTFPLPLEAVLLDLVVDLGTEQTTGVVVAKTKAEKDYETAMDEGNTPIMLERS